LNMALGCGGSYSRGQIKMHASGLRSVPSRSHNQENPARGGSENLPNRQPSWQPHK
jgi:hypothetical protein